MKKFSLPAGTTNRQKWQKAALSAVAALYSMLTQRRELSGVIGTDTERSSIVSIMFGEENQAISDLYHKIGDLFDWQITKDNADRVMQAFIDALPEAQAAIPVDDMRITAEQRKQQTVERNNDAAIYEQKQKEKAAAIAIRVAELKKQYPQAVADNGKLSQHARAAKNMRVEIKAAFVGVKFSIRSESFSMGNAIRVEWENGPTTESVEALTNKYQYYINKCENDHSIEASAVSIVLSQSKYVTTSRTVSDDLKDQLFRDICKDRGIEYGSNAYDADRREYISDLVWRGFNLASIEAGAVYSGFEIVNNRDYVPLFEKAKIIVSDPIKSGSLTRCHVAQHKHTKKGFMMYMVILADNVDRDLFNTIRNDAKSAGGWYSRKWGSTPCGFAFDNAQDADRFAASLNGNAETVKKPTANVGEKLRALADKMSDQIAAKLADRETNTPKKMAQAASARIDGERLARTQAVLYSLAGLHDQGTIPAALASLNTKKAIYDLMGTKKELIPNGYHQYQICTGAPRNDDPVTLALFDLLEPKNEADLKLIDIRTKIDLLKFTKIAGYFPTPDPVLEKMLDAAGIEKGQTVLETSAGSGAICEAVTAAGGAVSGFEINHTLAGICKDRGFAVECGDYLQAATCDYDRVVINPPFEKLQAIDHIFKAFDELKIGGRLVAIVPPSVFYRSDNKCLAFQAWFNEAGGEAETLPAGSFKSAGTMIDTLLITVNK